jgi:hypothetical protein
MTFQLKPLSSEAVPRALAKAKQYRLLGEPREAESICLDVLECEPDNQEALRTLVLALTDRFGKGDGPFIIAEAWKIVARLSEEYDRAYYTGIIYERRAKAHLQDEALHAFEWVRAAMFWYEKSEALRPSSNDDAILRWNTCARLMMQELGAGGVPVQGGALAGLLAALHKCARLNCACSVEMDRSHWPYCSEHCKEAADMTELYCDCQHSQCRHDARRGLALASSEY